MTLAAAWCNYENPTSPTLWMATDSRIRDASGTLFDEGIKLYEVPVVCRKPGRDGFFDVPYFASAIGMVGAGTSLVYQHIYGTLVPLLSNLVHVGTAIPSTADLAALVGKVTTTYVRSLGHARPGMATNITLIVGGQVPGHHPQAYRLRPQIGEQGMVEYPPEPLMLGSGEVHFIGSQVDDAQRLLQELVELDAPGASRNRAALNVIRTLIDDREATTIGGEVQIGHTSGWAFRRVASAVSDGESGPTARMLLNSIDVGELGPVGPCAIGLPGMVSP